MKRHILAVPLLLCGAHAQADTPAAVAASNYQAGLTSGDIYASGRRASNMYDLNGGANFPLMTYLGATLTGDYVHTNIPANPFPGTTPTSAWPSCIHYSENLGTGLFVRNPSLGKIGINYGAGRQNSQCSATFVTTGTDSLNTSYSAVNAEYYFSTVTIAAARSKVHIESGSSLDSDTLAASWYPVNDARVTLAADGLDFKNTHHLGMEYQPELLGKSMSLSFDYTTQRQTLTSHSISVGFHYFFGTNVDLLARDRHYR